MNQKYMKRTFVSVLLAFIIAAAFIQPAGATPPEELNFTVELIYAVPSSSSALGSWESSGVLESSGGIYESISFAGWNEDFWFVKNLLSTLMLSDTQGSITIKTHLHEVDFEPFGLAEYTGSWVIVDGSGDYAGLHGQGTMELSAVFYWSCPENVVNGPCLVETRTYTGKGHFEPKHNLVGELSS